MKNPVGWFEIYVDDIERAKAFYQGVFKCELTRIPMNMEGMELWGFPSDMNSYGITGALCRMKGVAAGGNSTLVYFTCEDCAVEQGRVGDSGGKVLHEKFSIGEHGFISVAMDSEGNMIGLHSLK